ncbi:hypothetical protein FQN54_008057 [Arachnomyces sp. PD_36]|nr:hypothetical protein FQN54_008057 [Arachnomyces sp. PD_36]
MPGAAGTPAVPPAAPRAIDEPYDRNEPLPSLPVSRQRQQHRQDTSPLPDPSNSPFNNNPPRSPPRRSASSSSSGRQLRRVSPRLETTRLPRSASARTAPRHQTNVRFAQRPAASPATPAPANRPALSEAETEPGRSSSRESEEKQLKESYWPRRSTRVSPRTASAILWALEEAIRHPFPFTPVPEELNASMSDLVGGQLSGSGGGNGRAQNAGSRTAQGPVPVQTQQQTSGVRTPTDIMRQRRDREARKKAEQEARERDQQEAERRAAREAEKKQQERYQLQQQQLQQQAAGVAGETTTQRRTEATRPAAGGDTTYVQDTGTRLDRGTSRATAQTTAATSIPQSTAMAGNTRRPDASPSANTSGQQQYRQRGASVSQGQPRTVPAPSQPQQHTRTTSAYTGQQPPPQQSSHPRTPAASNLAPPPAEPTQSQQQSQAPPAGQPTTQQSQQGRPRATFPHAFERWESLSSHWEGLTSYWIRKLEQNTEELNVEPLNRQLSRQVTDLSAAGANLFHAVVELQRLRASSERKFQRWFFDTRAEQEKAREVQAELEKQLKAERQSRTDSTAAIAKAEAERAKAEEATKEMRRELQISKEEARRAWEELGRREQEERDRTASLRNGDPTLVGGVQVVPMMQGVPSRQTSTNRPPTREGPYPGGPGSAVMGGQPRREPEQEGDYPYEPQASSPTETDPFTEPAREQGRPAYRAADPQGLGASPSRQPAARPAATSAPPTAIVPAEDSRFYQHEGSALHAGQPRVSEADERSFIPSSEGPASDLGSEDYPGGQNGSYGQDPQGRRVFYPRTMSDDSEEYEIQDQLEHEREYRQRYGDVSGPGYTSGATATSGAQSRPGYGDGGVDYSGTGWGAETGWESVTPRHRHPTRLSDVLEEDERSRTSASRASQASRTMH